MTGILVTTLAAALLSCGAPAVAQPVVSHIEPEPTSVAAPATGPWCDQIVIIGDSLTARGNGALHASFPDAIVNARGGRLTSEGAEPALGIAESNAAHCWVIALGTNDAYFEIDAAESAAAINRLLGIASGRVWWVLPEFAPAAGLDASEFVSLIPTWVNRIELHTPASEFAWDGIHLGPAGYERRAQTIAAAIAAS